MPIGNPLSPLFWALLDNYFCHKEKYEKEFAAQTPDEIERTLNERSRLQRILSFNIFSKYHAMKCVARDIIKEN